MARTRRNRSRNAVYIAVFTTPPADPSRTGGSAGIGARIRHTGAAARFAGGVRSRDVARTTAPPVVPRRWVYGTTKCAGHEPQPVKTRLESPNALRPRPFARIRSRSMRLLTRTYRLTEPNRGVPSGPVDRSAVGPRARAGGDEPKQHGRERSVGRMATRGYRRRALSAAPSNSLIIPPGGVSHGGEQGPSIVRIAYAEKSSRCQCML